MTKKKGGFTAKDFALYFNVSTKTIHRKIQALQPIFKLNPTVKRKRIFTNTEAEAIMNHLKKDYPEPFNRLALNLKDIAVKIVKSDL